jgi:hypothetical protein
MRRFAVLLLGCLLVAGICSVAAAQSAEGAYRALKKLEAKTQVGISPRDYSAALGEARFELNMFMEGPEAKRQPQVAQYLTEAMKHFQAATKFINLSGPHGAPWVFWEAPYEQLYGPFLREHYPQALKPNHDGGALTKAASDAKTTLQVELLLGIIWGEASKALRMAGGELK